MAKRKFGEPPGRTRTKRQTKKKGNRYSKFGLAPAFVGDVAKGLGEDLVSMGKTAFDPRLPFMRGKDAEKAKRDAALLGMTVIPGGKLIKPIAKVAKATKKTTKTPGTSTVKKTTKKAAEKKTTKKTTAKKTTAPVKPKSMIDKQRARDKEKIARADIKKAGPVPKGYPQFSATKDKRGPLPFTKSVNKPKLTASARKKQKELADKRNKGDGKAPPVTRRPADSEVLTAQEIADKAATKRLKDIQRLRKDKSAQPKKGKAKSDAPAKKTVQVTPKRPAKYDPEPTTTRNKQGGQGRQRKYTTKTEAARDAMLDKATGGKWSKGLKDAPFGARGKTGYPGKEKAHQRANKRDAAKREAEKGRGKTSSQREKEEISKARTKKAGGQQKQFNAITDTGLGGDISVSQMSAAQLRKALANPRSATSRLKKDLEKRAKRGNLREGDMQVLNRLRDNTPARTSESQARDAMQYTIRPSGQPNRVAGSINPPAVPKASNQKWRGEGGKDAPKGPKGKSGTAKRGDKITEAAKEEDGVTRIKGTGGQARRVIAPSKDVAVARGGPRGRRVGGGATSGRKPISLGSGRKAPSKDVVRGEVVRGGRTSGGNKGRTARPVDVKTRPVGGGRGSSGRGPAGRGTAGRGTARAAIGSGATKGKGKKVRDITPAVGLLAGGAIGASRLGSFVENSAPKEPDKDKVTPRPKKPTSQLRDKYGRKIDRTEFNRREAYRKSLEGMTEAEKKKARKAEMKKREAYRARKGKGANIITRNLDLKEGVSSRKVNKEMKAAAGKGGKRQAAIDARKKYQRKK